MRLPVNGRRDCWFGLSRLRVFRDGDNTVSGGLRKLEGWDRWEGSWVPDKDAGGRWGRSEKLDVHESDD